MKQKVWATLSHVWVADYGLSIFLALQVSLVFFQPMLRSVGGSGRIIGDVIFTLLLITGAGVVPRRRPMAITVGVAVSVALLLRWTTLFMPFGWLQELRTISALVCYCLLIMMTLAQVFREGPVTIHRVQGAIAVYLLLGLAWAASYELLVLMRPGAFTGAGVDLDTPRSWIYYSFVTLTTVGYGDITPVHPLARSLAVFEALTGQLFPAILLARLVSLVQTGRGRTTDQ
jgi:hypothetical protein